MTSIWRSFVAETRAASDAMVNRRMERMASMLLKMWIVWIARWCWGLEFGMDGFARWHSVVKSRVLAAPFAHFTYHQPASIQFNSSVYTSRLIQNRSQSSVHIDRVAASLSLPNMSLQPPVEAEPSRLKVVSRYPNRPHTPHHQ